MLKSLIVLPCRYGSTRLAAKHLIRLSNGKTIAQMTFEQCQKTRASRIIIATDHPEIKASAEAFGAEVVMTSSGHVSGSDRVAEAASRVGGDYDLILNIQGDEPLVSPETIDALIAAHEKRQYPKAGLITAMTDFHSLESLESPSNVKVVCDEEGYALYFSRAVIPFDREANLKSRPLNLSNYKKHLGLYAFERESLLSFISRPKARYEALESLEQLRVLESLGRIGLVHTPFDSIGIDTAEDVKLLEARLLKQEGA